MQALQRARLVQIRGSKRRHALQAALEAWQEAVSQAQLQAMAEEHHLRTLSWRALSAMQSYYLRRMHVFSMQCNARRLRYKLLLGKAVRCWHTWRLRKAQLQSLQDKAIRVSAARQQAAMLHAWARLSWVLTSKQASHVRVADTLAGKHCVRRALACWQHRVRFARLHSHPLQC